MGRPASRTAAEYAAFINDFYTKHGKVPSADAVRKELGGSWSAAAEQLARWQTERTGAPVEVAVGTLKGLTDIVADAIRAALAGQTEAAAASEAARAADMAALADKLDLADTAQRELAAELAARTTDRDRLMERTEVLATERDRLRGELVIVQRAAAEASALLGERTRELDRLRGQIEAMQGQLDGLHKPVPVMHKHPRHRSMNHAA